MHKRITTAATMRRNFDSDEGYEATVGYGRSKLANLLFTFELSRRLQAAGQDEDTCCEFYTQD